jgi:hypothetical protein
MKKSLFSFIALATLALASCEKRIQSEVIYEGPAGPVAAAPSLVQTPASLSGKGSGAIVVPCSLPAPIEKIPAPNGSSDIVLNVRVIFSNEVNQGPGVDVEPLDPATMFGLYYFPETLSGWDNYVFFIPDIVRTECARAFDNGRLSWSLNLESGDPFYWYLRSYIATDSTGTPIDYYTEGGLKTALETLGSKILTAEKYPDHPELQLPVPDGATAPSF